MQEIADNVFIEQNSLGLYAGIIHNEAGTILIDSPIRTDGAGTWRGATARLVTGRPRYMVVLDTNYDRFLSIKGNDTTIVAHAEAIAPTRYRYSSAKSPDESYQHEGSETHSSNNRMQTPEINFDEELNLHLGDMQIHLEHRPGSNMAGVWAVIPERKVVFVGDSVLVDEPPFLAYANLERWEQDLKELASKRFKDYQIVSARSGLVNKDQVKTMTSNISYIGKVFEKLAASKAPIDEWYARIPAISGKIIELNLFNSDLFYNRLHWGITTYYELNCRERG